VKRPNRKAAIRRYVTCETLYRWYERNPYLLPRLLDGSTVERGALLELNCQGAVRAAWAAGEHGRVKAARAYIAHRQLSPASIAAMARSLADYNHRWLQGGAADGKVEWLYVGNGCCQRNGTAHEAHVAAWSALAAALSILVEIPLNHREDASELLLLLADTGWRHLPRHQHERVARGMGRYVASRISGEPFEPFNLMTGGRI
jgi:hypothetical protein